MGIKHIRLQTQMLTCSRLHAQLAHIQMLTFMFLQGKWYWACNIHAFCDTCVTATTNKNKDPYIVDDHCKAVILRSKVRAYARALVCVCVCLPLQPKLTLTHGLTRAPYCFISSLCTHRPGSLPTWTLTGANMTFSRQLGEFD